jgi:hypothetical protein
MGRARSRQPPRDPSSGARLAFHHGSGADPRPRHRRQHRDLHARERAAVSATGRHRSRSRRQHLPERPRRQAAHRHLLLHLHGDGELLRHLRVDDGRQHSESGPLSSQRRRARCGRRVCDDQLSRCPGAAAVAGPLVREHGGAARSGGRRCDRISNVDTGVPRRSIRSGPRHPHRRSAGDHRRHRTCQSSRHD